ncbi:MAG: hypothetical protein GC134_02230 [Proteobacteria bacterium]|nr:hypothetical protein [Pseudomonadota bacterium]
MPRFLIALACTLSALPALAADEAPSASRYAMSDNGQVVLDTQTGNLWMLDRATLQEGKPVYKPVRYEEQRNANGMDVEMKNARNSFTPTYGR